MEGICLDIYISLVQKYKGILFYEWLLQWATEKNVLRVSVFKGIAGLHNGKIEENHFIELGSHVPILISCIFEKGKEAELIDYLKEEKISLFYTTHPILIHTS